MRAEAHSTDDPAGLNRVPDFFIVGLPKCGTTALYHMLSGHPQIFMSPIKEPHYLSDELRYRAEWNVSAGLPETLKDYLALFTAAGPSQRAGEASAFYLWSPTAADNIASLQPGARIIAIVREPASFLRSLHMQCVQGRAESEKDFKKAMWLEESRRQGRNLPHDKSNWPQVLLYSQHVRFVSQLQRYYDRFPPERIHVMVYDDFRADNETAMADVLRFLEVDHSVPLGSTEANPTVAVRSQRLNRMVRSLYMGNGPVSRPVKRVAKTVVRSPRLRRQAVDATQRHLVFKEPDQADQGFMDDLRRRYSGEVESLSEFLGRDLVSLWGYDAL